MQFHYKDSNDKTTTKGDDRYVHKWMCYCKVWSTSYTQQRRLPP